MTTLATLTSLTLSAILSMARSPAVDLPAERTRLEALASDIAHVVVERDRLSHWLPGAYLPLPVKGPHGRRATALMLVAIAAHESGFRAEISDCRIVGSRGDATAFQLLGPFSRGSYTKRDLCASPRRAAERALFVLAHHASRCMTPGRWFAGYASGDCGRDVAAARRQCRMWERLNRDAGLLASCDTNIVRKRESK